MKLTEAKLKQMIKEMMTSGHLIHNGKPALSKNGTKIEDTLMSQDGQMITQGDALLDAASSTLDPLEADYLDALAKAAVASSTIKRLSQEEKERYRIPSEWRPPRNPEYDQWDMLNRNYREAYDRIRSIVSPEEADRIQRNFRGIMP